MVEWQSIDTNPTIGNNGRILKAPLHSLKPRKNVSCTYEMHFTNGIPVALVVIIGKLIESRSPLPGGCNFPIFVQQRFYK